MSSEQPHPADRTQAPPPTLRSLALQALAEPDPDRKIARVRALQALVNTAAGALPTGSRPDDVPATLPGRPAR
ncbi:MAG: hypothetical protein EOO54_14850, partial [Haliea sp.]